MAKHISGIQQIGIGVPDVHKAWAWYRKAFGIDVRMFEEAAEAAASEYASGLGEVLTLITAQRSRINLASQKTTLKRLRLDNRITLHLALGGDYQSRN